MSMLLNIDFICQQNNQATVHSSLVEKYCCTKANCMYIGCGAR